MFFLVISEFINGLKITSNSKSYIDLILLEIVLVVMMDSGTGWTVGRTVGCTVGWAVGWTVGR